MSKRGQEMLSGSQNAIKMRLPVSVQAKLLATSMQLVADFGNSNSSFAQKAGYGCRILSHHASVQTATLQLPGFRS
jgi:hypothetical protein